MIRSGVTVSCVALRRTSSGGPGRRFRIMRSTRSWMAGPRTSMTMLRSIGSAPQLDAASRRRTMSMTATMKREITGISGHGAGAASRRQTVYSAKSRTRLVTVRCTCTAQEVSSIYKQPAPTSVFNTHSPTPKTYTLTTQLAPSITVHPCPNPLRYSTPYLSLTPLSLHIAFLLAHL